MSRSGAWSSVLLALVTLIWAGQGTAVKVLEGYLGPVAITFLPFYVATCLLLPLLWRERRRAGARSPQWKDWGKFVVAGVGGQVVAQTGMTWGITRSLASNGAILNLMIPVVTAVLAGVMLGEQVPASRKLCLAIGLAGAFLLSTPDLRQSSFLHARYLGGNLLILAGTLGSAFYNVYCKRLMRKFQETEILIYSYIVASIASVPLLIWIEPFHWRELYSLDRKAWIAFAFLALFMYAGSMVLFFYVLRHVPVTAASTSLFLVPLFGALMAAIVVGERLTTPALAGTALVVTATILVLARDGVYGNSQAEEQGERTGRTPVPPRD